MAILPTARLYILSLSLLTLAPVAATANSDDAIGAKGSSHPEIVSEGFIAAEPASFNPAEAGNSIDDDLPQPQDRSARCKREVLSLADMLESEYRVAMSEIEISIRNILENQGLDQPAKRSNILIQQSAQQQLDDLINTARNISTPANLAACSRTIPHPRSAQAPNSILNIDDVEELLDFILLQIANQPANNPLPFEVLAGLWNAQS